MQDRRIGDDDSHAHKRYEDEFARLHKRFEDNEARFASNEDLLKHLVEAKLTSLTMHKEAMVKMQSMTEALGELARSTAGSRRMEANINGFVEFLTDVNKFLALIWKPIFFFSAVGGGIYFWLKALSSGLL